MKRYHKIPTFLLVSALLMTTGCGANNTTDKNNDNNGTQAHGMITEADARLLALQKAELETATFTKQEYDSHDQEFEFEFYTDYMEYDCDVSAADGTIRSYSTKKREHFD